MKWICLAILLICMRHSGAQIHNPGLTVLYEPTGEAITLKWHHINAGVQAYILERSSNGLAWQRLSHIAIKEPGIYRFLGYRDDDALPGISYYRLLAIGPQGSTSATEPVMAVLGSTQHSWSLYPNPVKDLLHLKYNGRALIKGVLHVQIDRINGQTYQRLRFASTTRFITIPVSNLGAGLYRVSITVGKQPIWSGRFVK